MIYISYRRNDVPGHAAMLLNSLSTTYPREKIFLDTANIAVGEPWLNRIYNALNESVVVLCVIGPRWKSNSLNDPNDFVRYEIRTALARGNAVLPLLFDGATHPLKEELPDDCKSMLDNQWLVFDPSDLEFYEAKLKKLPSIIDGLIARLCASGHEAATCRLCVKGYTNKGQGFVSVYIDDKYVNKIEITEKITQYIKFPIGWHIIEMKKKVYIWSRTSVASWWEDHEIARYQLFFEATEYEAKVERHEYPWPLHFLGLVSSYKFHMPVKKSEKLLS